MECRETNSFEDGTSDSRFLTNNNKSKSALESLKNVKAPNIPYIFRLVNIILSDGILLNIIYGKREMVRFTQSLVLGLADNKTDI